ncbi:MAG: hypothetical protein GEU91_22010 [Rhizobiales bacterium]|nr:hypothetical protein [Hyphomicrobiales bacterium]
MIDVRLRGMLVLSVAVLGLLALGACATRLPGPAPEPAPVTPLPLPPAFQPQELVGRWGFASFHRAEDQGRTEAAARRQCGKPYVIGRGPSGGVMLHLADERQPSELTVKGGPGGKTYVGPGPEPAGQQDREVVTFDGRVLVLRWLDPGIAGRYGVGVYVRCAPQA